MTLKAMWEDHRLDYYDHIRRYKSFLAKKGSQTTLFGDSFLEFPGFEAWLGRPEGVPDGKSFRDAAEKAYMTKGGAGPTESRHGYRKRQLQHVVCGPEMPFSIDHTFDAAKNFNEGNQVWNAVSGWTEPITTVLTRTTKVEEYIHAMEDLVHREGWEAPLMYADNWPVNKAQP